ncbi:helix-turn-helix domain-containing protein [Sphingobacterium griseoflavum]|uniref:HTH araC/xylS-type domain-containing protein n=1 Tax=Sphingobacterium griseoflavum TaxID=1474952 RepID=A0ABQ3HW51_9SPHI|nr:helix-turn-helix transcriptional regulator [Sphingobacterium griseoflavum]GHE31981.1 hypothetical protein GCM10017764_13930 [Sphingobacterium griseoflavum]
MNGTSEQNMQQDNGTVKQESKTSTVACRTGEFTDVNHFIAQAAELLGDGHYMLLFGKRKDVDGDSLFFLKKNDDRFEEIRQRVSTGVYLMVDLKYFSGFNLRAKFKDLGFIHYAVAESMVYGKEDAASIGTIFTLISNECVRAASDESYHILYTYVDLLLSLTGRAYRTFFNGRNTAISDIDRRFTTLSKQSLEDRRDPGSELPSVDKFARSLGVTKYYLSDISKALHGRTAQDRVEEEIVYQAKKMLGNTELSVAEIAQAIGFSEPQMLNRLFKKRTKETPLEYRISLI